MAPSVTFYDDLKNLHYYQPYYVTPFPVGMNPNYNDWLEKYCCEWAIINGGVLSEDDNYRHAIERSDVGLFSAVCFVNASKHRLEKLLKWGQLLFISDDYHSLMKQSKYLTNFEASSFWQDLLEALNYLENDKKTPNPKWCNFIRGIHEVMREITFDFEKHQIKRSIQMIERYVLGSIDESKWRNNIPTWTEYHRVRVGTVGIDMCMQLLEYSQEITLTDKEYFYPKMNDLFQIISEDLFLINDLLTFRKEVAESDYLFSKMKHSFTVLVCEGKTLQEAVNWIHNRIMECDRLIQKQIAELSNDPNLITNDECRIKFNKFFMGIQYFIGGYWRHAITARRYHGEDFVGALSPEGNFKYSQDKTILIPTTKHRKYEWL